MNSILSVALGLFFLSFQAQENSNLKKGIAVQGYDVVSYFNDLATEGKKEYSYSYQDAIYQFSTSENLETFKNNPSKFIPEYGGYCAYAIAVKGEKVEINPKTFQILNDKLYLFYNKWGRNTLDYWNKEGYEKLRLLADTNWEKIQKKKT
jgi:YHS domain-containing protein